MSRSHRASNVALQAFIQQRVKNVHLSIIIPAYNEARRLPSTLDSILNYLQHKLWDAEIIVVNDGSSDDTAKVVGHFATRHPEIRLIDNQLNQGKGGCIRDGMLHASGGTMLFTDADNSTPIEDADKLLAAICEGADIAIGSRWVDRRLQLVPQPWYRRLNGRIYNLLLRTILGLNYRDTQNGFKAFSRKAAEAIFPRQRISGWGFDAEDLFLAKKCNFIVSEIPVEYNYCADGSKIHPYRDGMRMLTELLKVRWYALMGAYSDGPSQASREDLRDARIGKAA